MWYYNQRTFMILAGFALILTLVLLLYSERSLMDIKNNSPLGKMDKSLEYWRNVKPIGVREGFLTPQDEYMDKIVFINNEEEEVYLSRYWSYTSKGEKNPVIEVKKTLAPGEEYSHFTGTVSKECDEKEEEFTLVELRDFTIEYRKGDSKTLKFVGTVPLRLICDKWYENQE